MSLSDPRLWILDSCAWLPCEMLQSAWISSTGLSGSSLHVCCSGPSGSARLAWPARSVILHLHQMCPADRMRTSARRGDVAEESRCGSAITALWKAQAPCPDPQPQRPRDPTNFSGP